MRWRTAGPAIVLAVVFVAVRPGTALCQPPTTYVFSHFAGAPAGGCVADGPALQVPMMPAGLAVGPDGTIYYSDSSRATIRKITPTGQVVTVAGLAGERWWTVDGPATHARFYYPGVLALHGSDLLVVDNGAVRVVDSRGQVTRYGPLAGANVTSIATAPLDAGGGQLGGELGIYAVSGYSVLRVEPYGTVTTLAGMRDESGYVDGAGRDARFAQINALAIDAAGNVYVSDGYYLSSSHGVRLAGNTIRKISPAGVVTTLAGTAGTFGWRDGQGAEARFTSPRALALDRDGNLYVFDQGGRAIRRVTPTGQVTTPAFVLRYSNVPTLLAIAPDGSVLFVHNSRQDATIRRLLPDGTTTVVAGAVIEEGMEDGPGTLARFAGPRDVAFDGRDRLVVLDGGMLRRIDPDGRVWTLAEAPFAEGLAADASNNVFLTGDGSISRVSPDGTMTTIAGVPGVHGSVDGDRQTARFGWPRDVAVDRWGTVYVTDNYAIRRILPNGDVLTLAGALGQQGVVDGLGAAARFLYPTSLAVDASGALFVIDGTMIRKVTRYGEVTTVAGQRNTSATVDGRGPAAQFDRPRALAVAPDGSLFVVERRVVRHVSTSGEVVTIAGGEGWGCEDGPAASVRFHLPTGIAVAWDGSLYVADNLGAIRRGVPVALAPPTIARIAIQPPLTPTDQVRMIIFGTNFTPGGMSVTSGGQPAQQLRVLSDTVLVATWSASQLPARVDVTTSAGVVSAWVGGQPPTLLKLGVYPVGGNGRISVAATGHSTETTFDCEVTGATVRRTSPDPLHGDACEGWVPVNSRVRIRLEASPGSLPGWYEGLCYTSPRTECELLVVEPGPTELSVWAQFMRLPYTRYFAEGVRSELFETHFAISSTDSAVANLRYLDASGSSVARPLYIPGPSGWSQFGIPASARRDVWPEEVGAEQPWGPFSAVIESTAPVAVQRTTTWDGRAYGGHADTGAEAPSVMWYFAEGATHSGFNLYYLLFNPGSAAAEIEVTFLLPAPQPPLVKTYTVPAGQRFTIWVDEEDPRLQATDVAAVIRATNGEPIVAERALYLDTPGLRFGAGHASTGVTAPAVEWLFAEGATGDFFDLFLLVANPNATEAELAAEYWLGDGRVVTRSYRVAPLSRLTIWVDREAPELADTAVATRLRVTNGVPVVADRAMWWPGPTPATWVEAHASAGATTPGTEWLVAEAEVDASRGLDTFVLVANPSDDDADISVCLYPDEGMGGCWSYPLGARRRLTISLRTELPRFPWMAVNRQRFSVAVTSVRADGNAPAVVVESATYWNAEGPQGIQHWGGGTCAMATRIR